MMKRFKEPDGATHAYEADGSQDDLIEAAREAGWHEMTDAEVASFLNPPLALPEAQALQTMAMYAAYADAVTQDVTFTTAAGVTKAFQADKDSAATLQATIVALQAVGVVPDGFYWKSSDNTTVPVTYGDLQALARTMLAQGWAAFQHLQQRKTSIAAAATVAAVQAIVW